MAGLLDTTSASAKILAIGDSGHGKTGAKAALVAAGYKLRMIDTDRGFKILRALLTDAEHYPYANYMKHHGIDPFEPGRISYIPIDIPMEFDQVEIVRDRKTVRYNILKPSDARAFKQVLDQLREWKDPEQGINLGPFTDWDNDCVLDFDTLSTLAELAKFYIQDMNNRLGALEDDHGRDSGAAQELISRLMVKLTSPLVHCNVIVTTHITKIDVNRGAPLSPEQLLREGKSVDARGFPSVIGRALSPVLPKRWNDSFVVQRTGNSRSAERRIYTVPVDNTDAKNSVWLEDSYPISTGLAEIFAALRYTELPEDFISSLRGSDSTTRESSGGAPKPSGFGFGRK